jgi:hypothetical protein
MEKNIKSWSRKKFLSWGVGITSFLAIPAFLRFSKTKKESKTVKMLTQDGRLVSIDMENVPHQKKQIKPEEIHTWVNTKKTSL